MPSPLKLLLILVVFCLVPFELFAWTNGELLIWMDVDRGQALAPFGWIEALSDPAEGRNWDTTSADQP